ncbi:MAG: PEP-CTERM sorting domain-containing protein [Acidobacteriota bacterium]|nr:PEP-CTERM sorting domain-containing protein [Acidobacteriota bacterium]
MSVNETIGQAAYLDLSLRHLMQNPGSPGVIGSSKGAPQTPAKGNGTQGEGPTVETVDLGDVTGTVCDCGEILLPPVGGGFPKWPLLALAAVPLVFLKRGGGRTIDRIDIPQSSVEPLVPPPSNVPVVPPPPLPPVIVQPIPEPATLTLLGSSLIALGSVIRRRRRAGMNKAEESGAETPQEVASCEV